VAQERLGKLAAVGAGNRMRQQSITVLYWIIEERVNQDAKKYVKTDTSSKDMFAGLSGLLLILPGCGNQYNSPGSPSTPQATPTRGGY